MTDNVEWPEWPEWPICSFDAIDDPGARGFLVGDGDWPFRGFVLRRDGELFAYANICPHARHPLDMRPDSFLVKDGTLILCGSHGARFVPESGRCVYGPCVGASLLPLAVRIDERGDVRVRAPDSLRDEWLAGWFRS